MLGGTDLVISLLVVFMGSLVYSTVSFGMGLVIVPFLLLFVLPIEAVIIVDVLIAIVAICVAFEARKEIVLNKTYVLIIGAAVAIPIGAYALDVTDPTVLKLVIGGAIIMLGIISLLGINVPLAKNRITGLAIGFVTYLCITALGIGGPLSAWYAIAQKWSVNQTRGTLSAYFTVANLLALFCYISLGMVTSEMWLNVLILSPATVAGILASRPLVKRLKLSTFRYVSITIIFLGGFTLLSRELYKLLF